jgi:uncharacterized damage-inducible protein DinB
MNKQDILILYQYNAWSNAKLLHAASDITREQFLAPTPFPHGSLQGTLIHALFGEWLWRQRWEATAPPFTFRFKPEEFPTVESLRARWADEEARLMNFVANVTEERLYSKFKYTSTEGYPYERMVWETMVHLVNHGTQHKTEAAAILTSLGHSPGDIDLIVYLNEAG